MAEIICGIYKITNPIGCYYIGASKDIIRRCQKYKGNSCRQQRKLYKSLTTYGWDYHTLEILEKCSEPDLKCRERYWQDFYDVLGENGLNHKLTECGDLKQIILDETLKIMSEKSKGENNAFFGVKGKDHPCFGFASLRNTRGELNPMFGRKQTEESKQKIGQKNKLTTQGSTNPKAKKVVDTKLKIIYGYKKLASERSGVNFATLSKYLTGLLPNKTSMVYLENYEGNTENFLEINE